MRLLVPVLALILLNPIAPAATPVQRDIWVDPALANASGVVTVLLGLDAPADDAFVGALRADGFAVVAFRHVPVVAVLLDARDLARVLHRDHVVSAALDAPMDLMQEVPLVWPRAEAGNFGGTGDELTRADEARALGYDGSGVGLAVIDLGTSGLHPGLRPRELGGPLVQNVKAAVGRDEIFRNQPHSPTSLFVENLTNSDLSDGHGTHTAGIAAGGWTSDGLLGGRAPGVDLIAVGTGDAMYLFWAIAGMDWVIEHREQYNIRIVSNSYGLEGPYVPAHPQNLATKAADDAGILVLFSAGNYGPAKRTMNSYAQAPYVLAVGSTTMSGAMARSSSRGDPAAGKLGPDLVAPGSEVISGRNQPLSANEITLRAPWNDAAYVPVEHLAWYRAISGTSMACPQVAGIAALALQANPSLTNAQLRAILTATARPLIGFEDYEQGAGMVDAAAAVRAALGHAAIAPRDAVEPTVSRLEGNDRVYPFHGALVGSPYKGFGVFAPDLFFPVRSPAESVTVTFSWRSAGATTGLSLSLFGPDGDLVEHAEPTTLEGSVSWLLTPTMLSEHENPQWSGAHWRLAPTLAAGLLEWDAEARVAYATSELPAVTHIAEPPPPPPPAARVPRANIVIQTNADFTAANGVTRGSGTAEDPFVIEGWDIAGGLDSAIVLGRTGLGTTAYVVIQNVWAHDTRKHCIDLNGAQHVTIRDSRLEGCDFTINSRGGLDLTVERNEFASASRGPSLYGVLGAVVRDNHLEDMALSGILLSQGATQGGAASTNVIIEGNTIIGHSPGIWLLTPGASANTIRNNAFGGGSYLQLDGGNAMTSVEGSEWLEGAADIRYAVSSVRTQDLPLNTIVDAGSNRASTSPTCFTNARADPGPGYVLQDVAWDYGDGTGSVGIVAPCHAYADATPRVATMVATFTRAESTDRLVLQDTVRVG